MVCQVVHMSIWLTIGLPGIAELPTPLMGISSSFPNILRFGDCDGTLFQAIPISCYVTRMFHMYLEDSMPHSIKVIRNLVGGVTDATCTPLP